MILLNDTEAAITLGITKELLYAYVKNAPKKHFGHHRKLVSISEGGKNFFEEKELLDFDNYLKEPWSRPGDPRPEIPKYIQEYLKVEIGGKCPISGKGYPLDNAHIVGYAESLNHHHHNLIRIAKEEHTKVDNGVISRQILSDTKARFISELRLSLKLTESSQEKLSQTPKPDYLFVGRSKELMLLTELLEFNRLIIIQGLGGIGKTQLLLNALSIVQYHNPVVWIDVETVENFQDFKVVVKKCLFNLTGQSVTDVSFEALQGIPFTIVFDSLEKLLVAQRDELEDYLQRLLTQSVSTQILITSQLDLSILDCDKRVIKLKGLSTRESLTLFRESGVIGDAMDDNHLKWLLEFCNGHPLCIRIVSSLIKFYKSTDNVIDHLSKSGGVKQPMRIRHTKTSSLEVSLSTVYDCLSDSQIEVLQYIKYFPGGLKSKWADGIFGSQNLIYDVAILQQFFLLEVKEDQLGFERYYISNPIRPFLRERSLRNPAENESVRRDAVERIMMEAAIVDHRYIERNYEGSLAYGLQRMDDEMPNLLEALRTAREFVKDQNNDGEARNAYLRVITFLANSLGKYCFMRGDFDSGLLFSQSGIDASIDLNDFEGASTQYMYLIQIQTRQYDLKALTKTVLALKQLANNTGNTTIQTNAEWAEADLFFSKYEYDKALLSYTAAFELLIKDDLQRKWPTEDEEVSMDIFSRVGNLALLRSGMARCYEHLGNYTKSIYYLNETIRRIESFDEGNVTSCYHHLAYCLCRVGDVENGLKYYYKALEGFAKHGNYEYFANSLSNLGEHVVSRSNIANHSLLNRIALISTLNSLSYQIIECYNRVTRDSSRSDAVNEVPPELLYKSVGIIKVISLTKHSTLLSEWAQGIADTLNIEQERLAQVPNILMAILNLAHCVGGVTEWNTLSSARNKIISAILQSCLLINASDTIKSKTEIFQWLTVWMRENRVRRRPTATSLFTEALQHLALI